MGLLTKRTRPASLAEGRALLGPCLLAKLRARRRRKEHTPPPDAGLWDREANRRRDEWEQAIKKL